MDVETSSQKMSVNRSNLILFTSQITLVFIVVIAALINLSIQNGNRDLWTVVLTSCLGYVLPNPKLKLQNGNENDKNVQQMVLNDNK